MASEGGNKSQETPSKTGKRVTNDRGSSNAKRQRLEPDDDSTPVRAAPVGANETGLRVVRRVIAPRTPSQVTAADTATAAGKSGNLYPRWQFDPFGLDNPPSADSPPSEGDPALSNPDGDDGGYLPVGEDNPLPDPPPVDQNPEPELPDHPSGELSSSGNDKGSAQTSSAVNDNTANGAGVTQDTSKFAASQTTKNAPSSSGNVRAVSSSAQFRVAAPEQQPRDSSNTATVAPSSANSNSNAKAPVVHTNSEISQLHPKVGGTSRAERRRGPSSPHPLMPTLPAPRDDTRGVSTAGPSSLSSPNDSKQTSSVINTPQITIKAASAAGPSLSGNSKAPKRPRGGDLTPTPVRPPPDLQDFVGRNNMYNAPPSQATSTQTSGQQTKTPDIPISTDSTNTPSTLVTNTPSRRMDSTPSRPVSSTPLTKNTTPSTDSRRAVPSSQRRRAQGVIALDGQPFTNDYSIVDQWRVLERLISEWASQMVVPCVSSEQAARTTELPFSTILELADRELATAMWQSPAHAKYLFQIYMWNYLDKVWFSQLSTAWACEPLDPLPAVKGITAGLGAAVARLTIDNLGTVDTFNKEMDPEDRMAFFTWRKNTVGLLTTNIIPQARMQELVDQDVRNIIMAHQGVIRPYLADAAGWRRLIARGTEIVASAARLAIMMRRSDGVWRPFIPRFNSITDRNAVALHGDAPAVLPPGGERPSIGRNSPVCVTVVPGLAKIRMVTTDGGANRASRLEMVTRRKAKVLVGLTATGVLGQVGPGVGPVIVSNANAEPAARTS